MDLNLNSGSDNLVSHEELNANSQIDSLIQLNSSNYHLTLNHLSQLMNLNTQDCMINPRSNCSVAGSNNSDNLIASNSHNSSHNDLNNENNDTISPSCHQLDLGNLK